jgi:hypothetical protein
MKLPWYIKSRVKVKDGRFCLEFTVSKWWIRMLYVQMFFQILLERSKELWKKK